MKEVMLTNGHIALVDDEDFERVARFKWYGHPESRGRGRTTVYALTSIRGQRGKRIRMHRYILNAPRGAAVDHVDGNGLNNTKENLRLCTVSQNACNSGPQKNNTSGYKGVTFNKNVGKWQAQIQHNKKREFIGLFSSPEEAAEAYRLTAERLHGAFARTERFSVSEAARKGGSDA